MINLTEKAEKAEKQIREHQRIVDYQIREYPVEILVSKYLEGAENDTNEIFVPDYQRNFIWPEKFQSRFIESILIGLPIPYLFAADVSNIDEKLSGRLEIVDGTQRIRTLAAFLENELCLSGLEKLTNLNDAYFSDLMSSRQRRFKRSTIRLIELTEKADEDTRRDMFDRINNGILVLNPMETRRGVRNSKFIAFIGELAKNEIFRNLAPLSAASIKRHDYDELVLRFFAYLERYDKFKREVTVFVNEYLDKMEGFKPESSGQALKEEWKQMLNFVDANFEHGFKKGSTNNRTPRVRFEAIAVGVALAFRENPDLVATQEEISQWAYGEEFNRLVTSDGSNSGPRVIKRIEFVRDKLLQVK